MSTTSERLLQLRWLLLSAVGAGACGGTHTSNGDGASGRAGTGTAGSTHALGGSAGTGTTTGGSASNGGSAGVAGTLVGGGSGVGATSGSSGAGVPHGECAAPLPANAGFVTCSDGLVHRVQVSECENRLPPEPVTCGVAPNTYVCDGAKRESCGTLGGGVPPATSCDIRCAVDADCGAGQICLCDGQLGACVSATCTVDADCGAGYFCRLVQTEQGLGCGAAVSFQCQLPEDACTSSAECGPGIGHGSRCQPDMPGGPLRCAAIAGVACGRPYLVQGSPRLACLATNTDWAATLSLDASKLDARACAALAEGWNRLGLLEHASVAAFARFTLQLLGLGAPHALVLESNQAILDETRHVELCFGLAASFGSNSAGPGKLDSAGALARLALPDVVLDTFIEGCLGETVATLEALEALASATFPAVRKVLEQIAEDEARHAALAWRFLAWGTAQQPALIDSLRGRLALELERAAQARAAVAQQSAPLSESLAAGGLLSAAARAEVRLRALREIVAPCLAALPIPSDRSGETNRADELRTS